jgi:peptide/nickel transport system substrate-binding protein
VNTNNPTVTAGLAGGLTVGLAGRATTPAPAARKDEGMRTSAVRRAPRARARGAIAVIAACALAACGGAGGGSSPPKERVFIDLVAALPRSLDPADEQGSAFDRLETSLASTLVRPAGRPPSSSTLAPPDAVVGFLASSWKELANGDYVFDLRRGVRSAYGHTLSARDVEFSFRRELAGSATARFLASVAKISLRHPISVIGPTRVRLNVAAPSRLTLAVLADFRFAVIDSRAVRAHQSAGDPRAHSWLAKHLAFYGAYELSEFDPGRRLLLSANPHFSAPLAFSHLAIEALPSTATRVADLGAAAASHTSELDWAGFQAAAHTSGIVAQTMPSTTVSTLVPDERFRPFASVLVRRAISLALDRAAISRAAFGGLAKPARHPEPSTIVLPAGEIQPSYGHDVALARRLLARAGYPHGFSFVLAASATDGPGIGVEMAAIISQLRRVGLTVDGRSVRSAGELARLARAGALGAVLESTTAPIASASFDLLARYLHNSPANFEGYRSPALDALARSLTAGDAAASSAAERRALTIVGTTYPVIPLLEIPSQNVTLAQIGGYAAYAAQATYYDLLRA